MRATAGDASQRTANSAAKGHAPGSGETGHQRGGGADRDPTGHPAIVAGEIEPLAQLGLGGRRPFEQMPSADQQAVQRTAGRIEHQRRLMGEEDDQQSRLRQRQTQVLTDGADMTAERDIAVAG